MREKGDVFLFHEKLETFSPTPKQTTQGGVVTQLVVVTILILLKTLKLRTRKL